MNKYVLYLNANGDGFTVFESETFREIRNQLDANNTPACITQALSCKSRKEVESYIQHYLMSLKLGTNNGYFFSNSDGTQTQNLCHPGMIWYQIKLTTEVILKNQIEQ